MDLEVNSVMGFDDTLISRLIYGKRGMEELKFGYFIIHNF